VMLPQAFLLVARFHFTAYLTGRFCDRLFSNSVELSFWPVW